MKLKSFTLNLFVIRPTQVNQTCSSMKKAHNMLMTIMRASNGIPEFFTDEEALESIENGNIQML